jgi:hypothetical protein
MTAPDIKEVFLPNEAAKYLGISTQKLSRLRRLQRIHGTQVGKTNLYTYTIADLKQANLNSERRGPKPKQKNAAKSEKSSQNF